MGDQPTAGTNGAPPIAGRASDNAKLNVDHDDAAYRREQHNLIVQTISSSVNGVLAELGYFPGMIQKLEQLEAENLHLRERNASLYEDNMRLVQWHQLANKELDALRRELSRFGINSQNPLLPIVVPRTSTTYHPGPPQQQFPRRPSGPNVVPQRGVQPGNHTPTVPSQARKTSLPPIQTNLHHPGNAIPTPISASTLSPNQQMARAIRMGHVKMRSTPSPGIVRSPPVPLSAVGGTPTVQGWSAPSYLPGPVEVIDLTALDGEEEPKVEGIRKKRRIEEPDRTVSAIDDQLQSITIRSPTSAVNAAPLDIFAAQPMLVPSQNVKIQSIDVAANAAPSDAPTAQPMVAPSQHGNIQSPTQVAVDVAPPVQPMVVPSQDGPADAAFNAAPSDVPSTQAMDVDVPSQSSKIQSPTDAAVNTAPPNAPPTETQPVDVGAPPQNDNGDIAMAEPTNKPEQDTIEVDEDGFVTVEICLNSMFDDDDETNTMTCWTCMGRYTEALEKNPNTDSPKPEPWPMDTPIDVLRKHCETLHPAVWNSFRAPP